MKTRQLMLFILLILSIHGHSQKLQMGLRFNPQIGWFNLENNSGTNYIQSDGARMGFSYGLMGDYLFTDNYAFSTGIFHNIFGGKTTPMQSDTFQFNKWNMQYIQIPLLLKMKTNEIGNFVYYGKFGLSPHIMINNEVDNLSLENVRFFNFYLTIGGGIHYIIGGTTAALAGITFHNGFAKINKEDEFNVKTGFFSLDFGVLF